MADSISRRHFTTLSTGLVLSSATAVASAEEKTSAVAIPRPVEGPIGGHRGPIGGHKAL